MGNKGIDNHNIEILYEDVDIIAINKPSGLMVHSDGRGAGPFLTDWIVVRFPESENVGEAGRTPQGEIIPRPGIVHRLDRDTSGVLLVARTDKGYAHLKKQFQGRTIKKKYIALVWGELKEPFGTINRPIGRSSSDFRKWSAQRGARGEQRAAETYWEKVKTLEFKSEKITLVMVEPKTGRTHQIRAHFAAIHHPIVGDKLYAPKRSAALGFNRPALHARSIEFDSCDGKRIKVEAPLPQDFKNIET